MRYHFPDGHILLGRLLTVRVDRTSIERHFCVHLLSLADKECDCDRFFFYLNFARKKFIQVNGCSDLVIVDGLVPQLIAALVPDNEGFREELLQAWIARN